jgi:molecular chaperone DnaJ
MIRRHDAKFDYYVILGLKEDASQDEIKRAYRRVALKYHPDKHPGDKEAEAMFILCTEAYKILSDPEKREVYDHNEHPKVRAQNSSKKPDFSSVFVDWLNTGDTTLNFALFTQYEKRSRK